VLICILWIVLALVLPIIPMLFASFIGFLIARISAGFKKSNIVQTILTIIFALFALSSRFLLEDMFRNNKMEEVLTQMSDITDSVAGFYLPARWFSEAIVEGKISGALLLMGVSLFLFAVVFGIVGRSYRNINSSLKNHAASKAYKMTAQKSKSILNTIAFKEFKRMVGSTTYLVNAGMGQILCVIVGVAVLFIGFDRLIAIVTQGAPVDASVIRPAIPLIIYFFIGMVATTAISPSIEGKNYWIVKSLPISPKTLYQGKMLFNLYITVPFMVFGILCLCISSKTPVSETILYVILGIALCAFSTAWGCVCGVKHLKLDWENEIEVIKQSAAVAIYLFPNMFVTMLLIVGVVALGMRMDNRLIAVIQILVASVLAALSYARVMALSRR
jgi:ABC-2 type transport system permease protein